MWDITSFRLRSFLRKKKSTPSRPFSSHAGPIHLKRTKAEVTIAPSHPLEHPKVIPCRVVLNDLTPEQVCVYAAETIDPSQQVQLTIEKPVRFFVRGKVVSCQNVSMNFRVISNQSLPFRIRIEFEFDTLIDREAVRQYCEDTVAECLNTP